MDKPRHVGELVSILDVRQSLLSHQLSIIREAELVDVLRKGRAVLYQLAPNVGSATTGKALLLHAQSKRRL